MLEGNNDKPELKSYLQDAVLRQHQVFRVVKPIQVLPFMKTDLPQSLTTIRTGKNQSTLKKNIHPIP
jgi:hypothetical protein